jgi:hypothetical protein
MTATSTLPGIVISTAAAQPLTVTVNGKPARLAIVTDDGQIVAAGPDVAAQARAAVAEAQVAYWRGEGHLRVWRGVGA